jgi:hypothetical protein
LKNRHAAATFAQTVNPPSLRGTRCSAVAWSNLPCRWLRPYFAAKPFWLPSQVRRSQWKHSPFWATKALSPNRSSFFISDRSDVKSKRTASCQLAVKSRQASANSELDFPINNRALRRLNFKTQRIFEHFAIRCRTSQKPLQTSSTLTEDAVDQSIVTIPPQTENPLEKV